MVTVRLRGRAGNQMFQLSCLLGYCIKHNLPYHIPAHTENDLVWPPYFAHLSTPDETDKSKGEWFVPIKERGHAYEELPFKEEWRNDKIILDGYFQSEKYFDHCREEIQKLFDFHLPFIAWRGMCSIHVRRGDYLLYPTKHPVVTEEYLYQALEIMIQNGYDWFVVVGDDQKWNVDFFSVRGPKRMGKKIKFNIITHGTSEIQDMKIQVNCESNIISNSSFSWWGAWLNQYPNKVVVTPHEDNWFGPDNKHLPVDDLLPKEWIRIKY